MKGDFPPSSSVTGFRLLFAASSSTILPVSVDPVKASLSTSIWLARAAPAVGPYPDTMFRTPGGRPASWNSFPA
nr:Uncharacterised protein [Ipomoea batatas]